MDIPQMFFHWRTLKLTKYIANTQLPQTAEGLPPASIMEQL